MTGANQGIGLEIVRQLCKAFDGKVILAGCNIEFTSTCICYSASGWESGKGNYTISNEGERGD